MDPPANLAQENENNAFFPNRRVRLNILTTPAQADGLILLEEAALVRK